MSCSGGCGCGSDCKCGSGCKCGGCKMCPDFMESNTVSETFILGVAPQNMKSDGSGMMMMGCGVSENGCNCKCVSNCTCNPCTCKK